MEKRPEHVDAFTFHSRHFFYLSTKLVFPSVFCQLKPVEHGMSLESQRRGDIFEAGGYGPPSSRGDVTIQNTPSSLAVPPSALALQIETVVGPPLGDSQRL